jgi:diguanylate cyclase (GGDEF)-like protein
VLREIATIIKASCREIDFVSKYGGDEFGILLPQTRLNGAEKVTRRVVDSVREHCFDGQTPGLITCSAGVSSFPRDGQTPQAIIEAADKALYQAKRTGKNTVVTTESLIEEMA